MSFNTIFPSHIQTLNEVNYYPVVGTVGGAGRIVYGAVKMIATFVAAQYSLCADDCLKNRVSRDEGRELDGIMHIFRGCIELIPGSGIALYRYDKEYGAELRLLNAALEQESEARSSDEAEETEEAEDTISDG